jgi:penicillin-binding protein 2
MPIDWQEIGLVNSSASAVVDPRRRLHWCVVTLLLLLAFVWCRAAQLEVCQGAAFREEALRMKRRERPIPAVRGRILARDGTVLACQQEVSALALEYRYLEDPPQQAWLEQLARKRLPPDQRHSAARLAGELDKLRQERNDLHVRLAKLCGIEPREWQVRARKIQARVERIAASARQRRVAAARDQPAASPDDGSWAVRLSTAMREILEPARDAEPERVTVAEELSEHVMAVNISPASVDEIQQHAKRYPGVRIVRKSRRTYPAGALAGHVLGYLGPAQLEHHAERDEDPVGRTGVEQEYDALLRGKPGLGLDVTDHAGRLQQALQLTPPAAGRDVTLTIDVRLQRTAEELLDSAVHRVALQSDRREPSGGAVLVMDVQTGEILAAASTPRYDPNVFAGDDSEKCEALLSDPAHPLFHRALQMALPPGSVFKTVTAAALLESAGLDPAATFHCQGYLRQPDRQRCEIYVRHGIGHGDITLAEALAESCNVYFFHHAENLSPQDLCDWAQRFGFGHTTGIDLPGEARGMLPHPDVAHKLGGHAWHTADTQAMSVGQGSLTATPLQVLRMMAAVANGGLMVTPHIAKLEVSMGGHPSIISQPVPGLSYSTLASIRAGLLRTVTDEEGTAHAALYLDQISIAGKTGTAEVGAGQPDHSWFAGYVPADRPRYALVVVLERAGDAAVAACPVARRIVLRMLETGLLDPNK